jgi:hypothetical protein
MIDRKLSREVTLRNNFDDDISFIFIKADDYYEGLVITDEHDTQLSFFTKQDTLRFLADILEQEKILHGKIISRDTERLFDELSREEIYLIWIQLDQNNPLRRHSLKTIKLNYYDSAKSTNQLSLRQSLGRKYFRRHLHLYTIPAFVQGNKASASDAHDIFVIVRVPECFQLEHKITKKTIAEIGAVGSVGKYSERELTKEDGLEVIGTTRLLKLRIPGKKARINTNMIYYVTPDDSDSNFISFIVYLFLGGSLFLFLLDRLAASLTEQSTSALAQSILNNFDTILGGFVTLCFIAMGLLKQPFTNRTRFWLAIPIAIATITYLAHVFK